jgi:deazaflavin-dependent oxidoreductase (nitroreductase family)
MTNLRDGVSVVGNLTTIGRKSGLKRTVELRFIYHQGCFYASSSRIEGKHWCQNMLQNPAVEIGAGGKRFSATAKQVTEEELRRRILLMRGSPADMNRRVFEIRPDGNAAGA